MAERAHEIGSENDGDDGDATSEWRASLRRAKWEAQEELRRMEREAEEQGRHWRNAP